MVQIGLNATIHSELVPPQPVREMPSVQRHIKLSLLELDEWIYITEEARIVAKQVIETYKHVQKGEGRRGPKRSKVAQRTVRQTLMNADKLTHEGRRGLRIGFSILEAVCRQMHEDTDYPLYKKED
jgi:hypothetical protein